jgi:hypothetical protein
VIDEGWGLWIWVEGEVKWSSMRVRR